MKLPQENSKGAAQEPLQTLQGPAGKNTNANLFPEVRATSISGTVSQKMAQCVNYINCIN